MKVIVGVGLLMIVWIVCYFSQIISIPKPEIYQYITLGVISIVQPLVIYWTIKRNYDSSNHLREELELNVTHNKISMQGESFYTEMAWSKIFKVDEVKNWFLVYQNNLSAILISKKDLDNKEAAELKKILSGITNVPMNLK